MNDPAHVLQRWILQRVRVEQDFKGAPAGPMGVGRTSHVERDAVHTPHVARARYELECRVGIDKFAYRPRGGDAVDVNPLPRGSYVLLFARRNLVIRHRQQLRTDPLAKGQTTVDGLSSSGTAGRIDVVARADLAKAALQRQ